MRLRKELLKHMDSKKIVAIASAISAYLASVSGKTAEGVSSWKLAGRYDLMELTSISIGSMVKSVRQGSSVWSLSGRQNMMRR